MTDSLWLDPVPLRLQDKARRSFQEGNVVGFLGLASNECSLMLVWRNATLLQQQGVYEQALLYAITASRTNNHGFGQDALELLLKVADKTKLLAAGNPLPGPGPFTLYRGVAGYTNARRIRGISWTGTLERATWFANRFPILANPAVYRAEVEAAYVLAYVGRYRNEDEYIVRLPPSVKVERLEPRRQRSQSGR
jgi:hypothetical protein